MFLLENSEFVPELRLRSKEEYRLYTELKRSTGLALDQKETVSGFEMGDIRVRFEDGEIILSHLGETVDKCSVQEFSRQPNATFRRLQRYLIDSQTEKQVE